MTGSLWDNELVTSLGVNQVKLRISVTLYERPMGLYTQGDRSSMKYLKRHAS